MIKVHCFAENCDETQFNFVISIVRADSLEWLDAVTYVGKVRTICGYLKAQPSKDSLGNVDLKPKLSPLASNEFVQNFRYGR